MGFTVLDYEPLYYWYFCTCIFTGGLPAVLYVCAHEDVVLDVYNTLARTT